jgi:hypothetical protein
VNPWHPVLRAEMVPMTYYLVKAFLGAGSSTRRVPGSPPVTQPPFTIWGMALNSIPKVIAPKASTGPIGSTR